MARKRGQGGAEAVRLRANNSHGATTKTSRGLKKSDPSSPCLCQLSQTKQKWNQIPHMPFTSLSPKKGPEARSGPRALYYPNELDEHIELFFNVACLESYQIRARGLSTEDREYHIYNNCDTWVWYLLGHKGYDSPTPLPLSPGISQGERKKKTKRHGTYSKGSEPTL